MYQDYLNNIEPMPRILERVFYKGGSKPKIPKAVPVAKPDMSIEVEASKRSLRDRLSRARGSDSTRLTTPGSLTGENTFKKTLG